VHLLPWRHATGRPRIVRETCAHVAQQDCLQADRIARIEHRRRVQRRGKQCLTK
jgi:hypothetical protein